MQFVDLKHQFSLIKDDVDARIAAVLDHGKYIMGPEITEMEQQLADYIGCEHALGVSSGTDALLIALMALDVGHGDEIITTPFSFIATAETIALLGARPVFVDIDPRTYNIDPAAIEAAITPKTRAIMPVSLYGQCAEIDAINTLAERHNLPVIEDGAQSFGATYKGRHSCALTTIGCTSFFPSKPLGCYGDGGAVFTNDAELAKAMREIRVHGQDRRYHHPRVGVNARMDSLQAAVILAKLALFRDEVAARQDVAGRYAELLGDAVTPPYIEPHNTSVYAQYTVRVSDRARVIEQLKTAGIPTAVHYPQPLHRQPAFASAADVSLPTSEQAATEVMSLPMHPYLTREDQETITAALIEAVAVRAA